jgi:hypothetical protein
MDGTNTVTTPVVSSTDVIQAVRESALLATVSISTWTAQRSDKSAGEKLTTDAGASRRAARVVINLLAGAEENIKAVTGAFEAVRSLHYSYTLPWVSDPHASRQKGPRLLPHLLFDKYLTALSTQKREALSLLDAWDFDADVARAKPNLGSLTRADYPTAAEVKGAFRVHMEFEPIAEGAMFRGLPDLAVERLSRALYMRQQRMVAEAGKSMWKEARDRVSHMVEQFGDSERKLYQSTIDGARDLLTLLPGWNLAGSPEVDEIVQDIKTMLDGVDIQGVRKSATVREDVAENARRVLEKLDRFGV